VGAASGWAVHRLLARYLQHAGLGQQANMPVDSDFRDVGQARAQVRGGEYQPPVTRRGAAAAVAVSRRGRPPPAAPLGRRHPAAVFLDGAARSAWTTGMFRSGRRSSLRASSTTGPGPVERPGGSCRAPPPRSPMSSENCSRRLACPRPTCWSATPAAGPLPDVSLIILCSRRPTRSRKQCRFGDTGHVAMHCRHPGTSSSPTGPARRGDVPIPGRRRLPPRAAPSAELGEKSNIPRVS
jgi:hypothetical protein